MPLASRSTADLGASTGGALQGQAEEAARVFQEPMDSLQHNQLMPTCSIATLYFQRARVRPELDMLLMGKTEPKYQTNADGLSFFN